MSTVSATQLLSTMTQASTMAIPITMPDFRFPNAAYYSSLVSTSVADASRLANTLPEFFKTIAVPLATHGSAQVLEAQCSDIFARLEHKA